MRLCDVKEYELRNGVDGVVNKYESQRERSRKRKIEWLFDLKSWLEVWEGKIARRGVGLRKLCMCRHKDEGPYAPWNIRIATNYENRLDWWEKKPKWFKKCGKEPLYYKPKTPVGIDQDRRASAILETHTRFGEKRR